MKTVLFLDKSDPVFFEWVKYYTEFVCAKEDKVILWSYWRETKIIGRLVVKHYTEFKSTETIENIEKIVGSPIWMALACERSFFDYSYHTSYYSYSRLKTGKRDAIIKSVIESLWVAIGEVDMIIEGLKDNFITALAIPIAICQNKDIKMIRAWSIWRDSVHIVNLANQTSTEINRAYNFYLVHSKVEEFDDVSRRIKAAFFSPQLKDKTFYERVRLVFYKWCSYEPISIRNLFARKFRVVYGMVLSAFNVKFVNMKDNKNRFVVYALHVMPEASILGSNPEIAHQFEVIRRISLGLPWGVKLFCKIHPGNKIGRDLDYDFVRKICSLPNVEILDPKTKLEELFKSEYFISLATINGTIAIDGLLAQKPVMLFGDTIFSTAAYFKTIRDVKEIWSFCQSLIDGSYRLDLKSGVAILKALESTRLSGDLDIGKHEPWLSKYSKILHIIENEESDFRKSQHGIS